MQYPLKPIDANGKNLAEGDKVLFKKAPEALLSGLPLEDQDNIKTQEGKPLEIIGFDEYGHVEIMFTSADEGTHKRITTIWVDPKELFKV
ncbi:MAG: hypothetical protein EPN97_07855 [Alphaproteobacteria bacterium]|nr:MAG: hypothetical protein EPN97_07855 [Alphaproteobacteria bacterium]